MTKIKRKGVVVVLVLSVVVSFPSCSSWKRSGGNEVEKTPSAAAFKLKKVTLHTVSARGIEDKRVYAADLAAETEVTLFPLVAERILSFPFEDGDRVKANQTIARIRSAGLKKGIVQMAAELESLDRTLENQQRELDRSRRLYNKRVITQQALEQVEAGYSAALAKRKSLEASLGQVEINAGNAVLKSPIDGFVIGKQQEAGDTARPGMPLCSVVDVDPILVKVGIIEKDLPVIREGMAVELTVAAVPGRVFTGKVTRILPVVDPATRTNEARIEIDNPVDGAEGRPLLKPGMFGRVSIVAAEAAERIVVPSRALMVPDDGAPDERNVFTVDAKDIAHAHTIRIGVRNDAWYEVVSGLQKGDRVVLRGQYALRDKDHVEVIDKEVKLDARGEVVE